MNLPFSEMLSDACSSLLEAVESERTDIVMSMLDHLTKTGEVKVSEVLSSQCSRSGTLLHHCVAKGLPDAARTLLLSGADPGIRNSEGKTVLDLAQSPDLQQVDNHQETRP